MTVTEIAKERKKALLLLKKSYRNLDLHLKVGERLIEKVRIRKKALPRRSDLKLIHENAKIINQGVDEIFNKLKEVDLIFRTM